MPLAGASPADASPHSWQRAAGFAPMLMAHAESRHRVRFCLEHAASASREEQKAKSKEQKRIIGFLIFSLSGNFNTKKRKLKAKKMLRAAQLRIAILNVKC
jgi:hypothetical protein